MHISLMALFSFRLYNKKRSFLSELCTCGVPGTQQDECAEKDRQLALLYYMEVIYTSGHHRHGVISESWELTRGRIDYRPAQNTFCHHFMGLM